MNTLFRLPTPRQLAIVGVVTATLVGSVLFERSKLLKQRAPTGAVGAEIKSAPSEQEILKRAQALLKDKQPEEALRLLQRQPKSSWNEARAVLTIRALCMQGHARAAKENLAMLRILAPQSAHIAELAKGCAGP